MKNREQEGGYLRLRAAPESRVAFRFGDLSAAQWWMRDLQMRANYLGGRASGG